MKKQKVRYLFLEDHDGGEIPNFHAWYVPGTFRYGVVEEDDQWLIMECDNPTCSGLALVSFDDLRSVPLGTVHPDPPGTQERYDAEMEKLKQ